VSETSKISEVIGSFPAVSHDKKQSKVTEDVQLVSLMSSCDKEDAFGNALDRASLAVPVLCSANKTISLPLGLG
jgi:hypothetical protein